jgi:Tol biopolymer transport system component/DNA-binding winged helix-turn-helix (wHTH) protein
METNGEPRAAVRFGSFQMDFRRGELRRDGHRVKLQGQPFHVLSMLLQHPGEVVTREELRRKIWPQDTFVDFDTGLYTAVKKLRLALNDTAVNPRFIETISRRGYRFLMEVQPAESATNNQHSVFSPATSQAGATAAEPGTAPAKPADSTPLTRRIMLLTIAGLTVCLIFVLLLAAYRLRSRPPKGQTTFESAGWKMSRLTTVGNCYDAIISPNGEFVAYVQDAGGTQSLWLRQIATGSDSRLIAPGEHRYWGLTFSPGGEYIYYVASRPGGPGAGARQDAALYRIALIGGPGIKLKEKLDSPVSFSPDGRLYAFVREDSSLHESTLMVASVDGDAERKLATSQLPDYFDFPSWSPDGMTIACAGASFRRPSRILFYAADGKGERQSPISSPDWGHIRKIQWLRDGTGLLMAMKNRQSADYQLWQLSYPAGFMRRVTNDLNSYVRLSATADTHALLTIQETTAANIWLARNGSTASARELVSDSGSYSGLSWTPDGRIVYAAETPGDSNIWIMDADGKNRKQLTHASQFYHHPVVSPDGRYLFFNACQGDDCDIWRTDRDGTHPTPLTSGSHVRDLHCTPDGKWIVYTSPGSGQWSTLWKVSVDGGNPLQLSKNLAPWAAVSPDGRWIACFYLGEQSDTQTGQPVLAIIPSQGGRPRRTFAVSATLNFLAGLQWTFDGKAITYIDDRDGTSNIWSQPVFEKGGRPTPVTDFKGDKLFEFAWSSDGSQLVYLRGIDNSDIVLVRNFGSSN